MLAGKWKLIFWCLFFLSGKLVAQQDAYAGTWQMNDAQGNGKAATKLVLQIATGEKNILYPARLSVQCGEFSGSYELLLVRKSSRELAISHHKFATNETPFPLESILFLFNGILDYSRDLKGTPLLKVYRKSSQKSGRQALDSLVSSQKSRTALQLQNFFKAADIVFRKINDSAWANENRARVLCPSLSPVYYGIRDTVHLQQRDGTFTFPGNKKRNNDLFTVTHNGRTAIEQQGIDKKDHVEEILLDTGLNILVFFAEQFANDPPGNGKLVVEFNHQKTILDLTSKLDSGATFIVAKFYCGQDQSKDKFFVNGSLPAGDRLSQHEKMAGSIVSTSRQLKFGIWDDAAEDGDTISININGRWLVQGFPVKKKPQFITVTLEPGPNKISFIANNLGSIPPNTSVLEIIDGNKRKSFFMEAGLGESNIVRIFYDVKTVPSAN